MGLTYSTKPAFIDRLIETGSGHFFRSYGHLCLFAADIEAGEHIGQINESARHTESAQWNIAKAVAIYEDLVGDLTPMEVAPNALKLMSSMDVSQLKAEVFREGELLANDDVWGKVQQALEDQKPLNAITAFLEEVKIAQKALDKVVSDLEEEQLDIGGVQRLLSQYAKAMILGQCIATVNRVTRQRYT